MSESCFFLTWAGGQVPSGRVIETLGNVSTDGKRLLEGDFTSLNQEISFVYM